MPAHAQRKSIVAGQLSVTAVTRHRRKTRLSEFASGSATSGLDACGRCSSDGSNMTTPSVRRPPVGIPLAWIAATKASRAS